MEMKIIVQMAVSFNDLLNGLLPLLQHHAHPCLPSTSDRSNFELIETASHDKEEVFVGSGRRSGETIPTTFKNLFFIL